MGLRPVEDGPRGPCAPRPKPRYWKGSARPPLAVIENDIRRLLDAPAAGAGAPTLAHLQDALTAGYAHTLALEAEQWRLQRQIAQAAISLADEHNELRVAELKRLARQLKDAEAGLARIRDLLASLRARADDTRAA